MVTFVCIHSFAKQEKRGLILDKIPFFLPLQVQCGQADPQPQVTAFSSALASFSHVPPPKVDSDQYITLVNSFNPLPSIEVLQFPS
jgi:hypothetical protein